MRNTSMKPTARSLGLLLGAMTLLNAPTAAAQNNSLSDEDATRMLQATARFLLSRAESEMSAAVTDRIRATLCATPGDQTLSILGGEGHRAGRINLANYLFPAVCNAVVADLPLGDRPALTIREGLRADLRALPQRVLEARPDLTTTAVRPNNEAFADTPSVAAPIRTAIGVRAALLHANEGLTPFIVALKTALRLPDELTLSDDARNALPKPKRRIITEQRAIIEALQDELSNANPAVLRARLEAVLALANGLRSQEGVAALVLAMRNDDPVAIGRATMALAGPIFPGAAGQLANFALAIASAEREDDVTAVIESFIEPVGSWRARGERAIVGVSAMLGFQVGAVIPFDIRSQSVGSTLAPTLSLGLQYSIPTCNRWSLRFHLQVLDLGALVRYNTYDTAFNIQELGERPISWTSVIAPGLFFGAAPGNVPIFFGIGASVHPEFGFGQSARDLGLSLGATQVFGVISTSFDLLHF